jgi:hypothetical protein
MLAEFELTDTVPALEGFGEAQIRAFGEINGFYNAWPYW